MTARAPSPFFTTQPAPSHERATDGTRHAPPRGTHLPSAPPAKTGALVPVRWEHSLACGCEGCRHA